MAKILLVKSLLLLNITILVLGQEDCSKPPKDIDQLKCCEPIKWEHIDAVVECEKNLATKPFCKGECILNVTNILQNGEMKPENLKALLDKSLKQDPYYVPIAIKAFTECFQMMKEKLAGKPSKSDGCNPVAGAALDCMTMKVFANCPADKWKNNKDCNDMKDFYSKCTFNI